MAGYGMAEWLVTVRSMAGNISSSFVHCSCRNNHRSSSFVFRSFMQWLGHAMAGLVTAVLNVMAQLNGW